MENNRLSLISKIITGTLAIVGIGASLLIFNYVVNPDVTPANTTLKNSKVEIDEESLSNIQSPPVYSTPVSAKEPGFGRSNPFLAF